MFSSRAVIRFFQCFPYRLGTDSRDQTPFHHFTRQKFEGPANSSFWRWATADCHQLGFPPAIKLPGCRRGVPGLAIESRGFTLEDKPLPDPINGIHMHTKGAGDLSPGHPTAGTMVIALQENLGVPDFPGWGVTMASDFFEMLPLQEREQNRILIGN